MSEIKSSRRTTAFTGEFTGWHMFGVLCLFFGTIITVNLTLAFNAATTWTGLMVKNTYVESQNFDVRRAELAPQAELEWQAQVITAHGGLRVALVHRDGTPVSDVILTGNLGRPVHEGEDRLISFQPAGSFYESKQILLPGLWRVQLQAIGPKGEVWIKTRRFIVPPEKGLL